jgi:hypothetical protein
MSRLSIPSIVIISPTVTPAKSTSPILPDVAVAVAVMMQSVNGTVDEHVKRNLVDELLFGKIQNGGKVIVKVEKNNLAFTFKSQQELSSKSLKGRGKTHALPGKTEKVDGSDS